MRVDSVWFQGGFMFWNMGRSGWAQELFGSRVKRTLRRLGGVGSWEGKGDSMVWGLRDRWVLAE